MLQAIDRPGIDGALVIRGEEMALWVTLPKLESRFREFCKIWEKQILFSILIYAGRSLTLYPRYIAFFAFGNCFPPCH
jgi:hypothetical protein